MHSTPIRMGSTKLDARLVTDVKEHRININAANLNRRDSSHTPTNFDPRPIHLRSADPKALDILRADVLNLSQPSVCFFLAPRGLYMIIHTVESQMETLLIRHKKLHGLHLHQLFVLSIMMKLNRSVSLSKRGCKLAVI